MIAKGLKSTGVLVRVLATVGLLSLATAVIASPAANLKRLLGEIDSLSGRFDQLVLDNSDTRLQQSQGEVAMQRPGLFSWKTAEPFPQLLVGDGEYLWLYDQDLEQVTRQALTGQLDSTPALLLSGDLGELEQAFSVEGPSEGDSGTYLLIPQNPQALFSVMRITLQEGVPAEIQLEDSLGQKTSVVFEALTINQPLEASLFQFTPPAGADLIVE